VNPEPVAGKLKPPEDGRGCRRRIGVLAPPTFICEASGGILPNRIKEGSVHREAKPSAAIEFDASNSVRREARFPAVNKKAPDEI